MPIYCITGTNRGLGLEFVRLLAQSSDNTILATTRPGADLADLKAIASATTHILSCDTGDVESIRTFAQEASKLLAGCKINFLLNNAGVNNTPEGETSLSLDADNLSRQMRINVIGPAKTLEFLLAQDALDANVRVLNMTSGLASMEVSLSIVPRKACGYSISKAALNMLAVHQSEDLRSKLPGAVVIVMDPGWVKTRMGGVGAILEPEESIGSALKTLHGLKDEDNGKFFTYNGQIKAW